MTAEIIFKAFPNLTETQRKQIEALDVLYRDWNAKINVISRKDIDNLFVHHVLHSFGIAKVIKFAPGSSILDVGTGGGFPGIPLAILFPKCQFVLEDSIGKKIRVATAVALLLQNLGQKYTDPSSAAIILGTESIFCVVFGVFVSDEKVTSMLAIGFVLIFLAIIVSETKLSFLHGASRSPVKVKG